MAEQLSCSIINFISSAYDHVGQRTKLVIYTYELSTEQSTLPGSIQEVTIFKKIQGGWIISNCWNTFANITSPVYVHLWNQMH